MITAGQLHSHGVAAAATVLVLAAAAVLLPTTLRARSAADTGPRPARVPAALWLFAALVIASTLFEHDAAAVQNALVYLSFVAVTALAAARASADTPMLLLRWLRGTAVVMAVVYLGSAAVHGPGTNAVYSGRIFGEVVWIGVVAAVAMAGRRSRWAYAAPVLLVTADLVSLSRTSTAVSALVLLGTAARGRSRRELGKAAVLGALIACGMLALFRQFAPMRDRFVNNDNQSVAGFQVGTSGRNELWHTTWESIQTAPWLGHGIGSAGRLLAEPGSPGVVGHPHNDYLRLWHDFGLLGLGLWTAAMVALCVGAYRRRKAATTDVDRAVHHAALLALVALGLNVVTSNLLVYMFVMIPVAVLVGTSMGRVEEPAEKSAVPTPRKGHPGFPGGPRGVPMLDSGGNPGTPLAGSVRLGRRKWNDPKRCTVDLRGFLEALSRRWLSVVVLTAVGLCAGLALTALSPPQYTATSQIFVATRATTDVTELNQGSAFTQARVQSYADIIATARVADPVVRELGLKTSGTRLAKRIHASARPGTVLIDITVTDTSPVRAASVANAVAEEAGRLIVNLETPPGQSAAPVHIGVTRSAVPATSPVSPRPLLNAAVGLFGGLLAGLAWVLLRHTLDTTLRTDEEVTDATGIPVLGSVPFDKAAPEAPLAVGDQAVSARAEAIRLIRTNLQFAQVDKRPEVIVVTSSLPGEGKTNTAANLALSLAQAGHSTCLVDADLRNPCVAKTFGLVQSAGLTSVLIGAATVTDVLQWTGDNSLAVLTSGPIPPNPAEILASERMREVCQDIAGAFDIVIVDTAPLLPVADTLGLAPLVDGAILVVRAGKTPVERVRAAADALRAVGAPVLGGVLSMTEPQNSRSYGYGYGYGNVDEVRRAADGTAPTRLRPVQANATYASAPQGTAGQKDAVHASVSQGAVGQADVTYATAPQGTAGPTDTVHATGPQGAVGQADAGHATALQGAAGHGDVMYAEPGPADGPLAGTLRPYTPPAHTLPPHAPPLDAPFAPGAPGRADTGGMEFGAGS